MGHSVFNISAMTGGKTNGRPHGGMMWIINKSISKYCQVKMAHEKFSYCELSMQTLSLTIYSIYCSNGSANIKRLTNELNELKTYVQQDYLDNKQFMIIGDFNCDITRFYYKIPNSKRDRISKQILKFKYKGFKPYRKHMGGAKTFL